MAAEKGAVKPDFRNIQIISKEKPRDQTAGESLRIRIAQSGCNADIEGYRRHRFPNWPNPWTYGPKNMRSGCKRA